MKSYISKLSLSFKTNTLNCNTNKLKQLNIIYNSSKYCFSRKLKFASKKPLSNFQIYLKSNIDSKEDKKKDNIANRDLLSIDTNKNIKEKENFKSIKITPFFDKAVKEELTNPNLRLEKEEEVKFIGAPVPSKPLRKKFQRFLKRARTIRSHIERELDDKTIYRFNYNEKDFVGHNPLIKRAFSIDNGSVGEIRTGRHEEVKKL